MEINQYYDLIKKNLLFILSVVVVFVGLAMYMTARKPIDYQSSTSVEVTRTQKNSQKDVDYYQFDNYYSVMVGASVSDNILSLITSPSVVAEIYQKAGYELPKGDVKDLGKTFTAKKKVNTSAVIDISYSNSDKEKAERMIETVSDVLRNKVSDYNRATETADFSLISNKPVVIEGTKPFAINGVIAGLASLFVALTIVFLREALAKK